MPTRRNGFAGVALVLALDKGAESFTAFPAPLGSTGSGIVNTRPWYVLSSLVEVPPRESTCRSGELYVAEIADSML